MSVAPVILLAFANDDTNPLQNLARERDAISDALAKFEDDSCIRLHVEPDAGIDRLFGLLDRFNDQVVMFHYGGHANATVLDLEKPGGANEAAHAGGLAKILGLSDELRLVFLNGCATQGQVKALIESGVKAVIATACPINDEMATDFAKQFYSTLAAGESIGKAFEAARALVSTRYGDARKIDHFRGVSFGEPEQPVAVELNWGLYTQPGDDTILDWKLPTQADYQVIVRGAASPDDASIAVNEGLIGTTINAVAHHNPAVGRQLESDRQAGVQTDRRTIRQQIIDSFPAPVGEQLRKLFASDSVDEERLRQLVVTFETITKLFAFAMLSQLWNARFEKPDLAISDEQWRLVDAFNGLDATSEASFDYVALIIAIDQFFAANKVEPFMSECSNLSAALNSGAVNEAWRFMNEIRQEIAGTVDPSEITSFCVQAEKHLGVLLDAMAFIVGYKLATIKRIDINKTRHKDASFLHRQVLLDRVTAGFEDTDEARPSFTENESVIILKNVQDMKNYLNLTPFVIDQNALTHNAGTKLYFYRDFEAAADAVHYYSIADATDTLTISDALDAAGKLTYLPVRELVHEFRERMSRT